jgi:hypothetical protein
MKAQSLRRVLTLERVGPALGTVLIVVCGMARSRAKLVLPHMILLIGVMSFQAKLIAGPVIDIAAGAVNKTDSLTADGIREVLEDGFGSFAFTNMDTLHRPILDLEITYTKQTLVHDEVVEGNGHGVFNNVNGTETSIHFVTVPGDSGVAYGSSFTIFFKDFSAHTHVLITPSFASASLPEPSSLVLGLTAASAVAGFLAYRGHRRGYPRKPGELGSKTSVQRPGGRPRDCCLGLQ